MLTLQEPKDRTFADLKRTDGKFKDAELAKLIYNAIEAPAGEFRARGTPGGKKFAFPVNASLPRNGSYGIHRHTRY